VSRLEKRVRKIANRDKDNYIIIKDYIVGSDISILKFNKEEDLLEFYLNFLVHSKEERKEFKKDFLKVNKTKYTSIFTIGLGGENTCVNLKSDFTNLSKEELDFKLEKVIEIWTQSNIKDSNYFF
jgi:hypothetical protein